jgi:hypothetical protein
MLFLQAPSTLKKLYAVVIVLFVNDVPYDPLIFSYSVIPARNLLHEDIKFTDGRILKPVFSDFIIVPSK